VKKREGKSTPQKEMKSEILYSDGIYFLYSIFDRPLRQYHPAQKTPGRISCRAVVFDKDYYALASVMVFLSAS